MTVPKLPAGARWTSTVALVGLLVVGAHAFAQNKPLSGPELRELIVGNTVIGPLGARQYDFSYDPDGRLYGSVGIDTDSGTWSIADDGTYCHEWTLILGSTLRCYKWFRAERPGRYVMVRIDTSQRLGIEVWRIRPGLR